MNRTALVLFAAASLFSSCFFLDPFGGGTTPGPTGNCAPTCNGDKTGCPQLGSALTAKTALSQGKDLAATILQTSTPKWVGAVQGIKITRQGTPSSVPEVTTVLGKEVKLYTAGWVFKYCTGMNSVLFGAGPEVSTAQEECGNFNCSAVTDTAEPTIDSAAAITTAFPSEPADSVYGVTFMPATTNNARIWTVTSMDAGVSVKIDADTGAIVP